MLRFYYIKIPEPRLRLMFTKEVKSNKNLNFCSLQICSFDSPSYLNTTLSTEHANTLNYMPVFSKDYRILHPLSPTKKKKKNLSNYALARTRED